MQNSFAQDLEGEGVPQGFWKGVIFTAIFFLVTPIALILSLFSLFTLSDSGEIKASGEISLETRMERQPFGARVYASLPQGLPSVSGTASASDARAAYLKEYFSYYGSSLESLSEYLVQASDEYSLDYRLLPAIAMKESSLCRLIPPDSHNCWGWGIHSEGTLGFDSFEEAIVAVSEGLREEYLDKGYESVEDIMSKYAHPSSTTWARDVSKYMNDIEPL